MPQDSSKQGPFLVTRFLELFQAEFSPEVRTKFQRGFGQTTIRPPQFLNLPITFPQSPFPVQFTAPGPGSTIVPVGPPSSDAVGGRINSDPGPVSTGSGGGSSIATMSHSSVASSTPPSSGATTGGADTVGGYTTNASGTAFPNTSNPFVGGWSGTGDGTDPPMTGGTDLGTGGSGTTSGSGTGASGGGPLQICGSCPGGAADMPAGYEDCTEDLTVTGGSCRRVGGGIACPADYYVFLPDSDILQLYTNLCSCKANVSPTPAEIFAACSACCTEHTTCPTEKQVCCYGLFYPNVDVDSSSAGTYPITITNNICFCS